MKKASFYSYILCAAAMLYSCLFYYPKWNTPAGEAAIGWDVSGYYWYLPSVFIYKDLKYQRFADSVLAKYQPTPEIMQFNRYADSSCVMTYSSGMAFMYLPLFTIAHFAAEPLGYPPDGFSPPYQFALHVGSMLFALIGLWYFRKLMMLYFSDKVTALLLLMLVFGTNYGNYAGIDAPQTHSWLFTLYVFLLLNTHYFYRSPSFKYAIRIGPITGLMILIRPSEMVAVLIPLLWGIERLSLSAFKEKIAFLKQHLKKVLVAVTCVLLVGSIQLIYWKYSSGHWLVYSYGKTGGFSWLPPHYDEYMFSYGSGWLVYTPLMFLAFIGIIPFIRSGRNKVAVLAFFFVNLTVVSAWDIWWYGGRAMVQSYAVLFMPIGTLVQYGFTKRLAGILLLPIVIVLGYVSLWVTLQAHRGTGLYDVAAMSKAYYWRVVGRWHLKNARELEKLKDAPELFEGNPKNLTLAYRHDFENDTSIHLPASPLAGNVSDFVSMKREYSTAVVLPAYTNKGWIRVMATFRSSNRQWTSWKMPQFTIQMVKKDGALVKYAALKPDRFQEGNQTKDLFVDIHVPHDYDSIKIFTWNPGSENMLLIDNIRVYTFQ